MQLADGVEKVDGGQQKHPQPHGQGDHPVDLVTEDEQHPHRGPGQAEGQRRVADGIPPVGQGAKTDTAGDQEREQKIDDEVPQGGLPGQQGGGEEQGEQSQVHQTKQNHPGGVNLPQGVVSGALDFQGAAGPVFPQLGQDQHHKQGSQGAHGPLDLIGGAGGLEQPPEQDQHRPLEQPPTLVEELGLLAEKFQLGQGAGGLPLAEGLGGGTVA